MFSVTWYVTWGYAWFSMHFIKVCPHDPLPIPQFSTSMNQKFWHNSHWCQTLKPSQKILRNPFFAQTIFGWCRTRYMKIDWISNFDPNWTTESLSVRLLELKKKKIFYTFKCFISGKIPFRMLSDIWVAFLLSNTDTFTIN